jgi:hypothetical protein
MINNPEAKNKIESFETHKLFSKFLKEKIILDDIKEITEFISESKTIINIELLFSEVHIKYEGFIHESGLIKNKYIVKDKNFNVLYEFKIIKNYPGLYCEINNTNQEFNDVMFINIIMKIINNLK